MDPKAHNCICPILYSQTKWYNPVLKISGHHTVKRQTIDKIAICIAYTMKCNLLLQTS